MQDDVIVYLSYTKYSKMSWTEDKVGKLKELWGKGKTASQIAAIIGGVSRNAVIGKAHRLNLSTKIKTRPSIQRQKNNLKKQFVFFSSFQIYYLIRLILVLIVQILLYLKQTISIMSWKHNHLV